MDEDSKVKDDTGGGGGGSGGSGTRPPEDTKGGKKDETVVKPPPRMTRFFGTVTLDPARPVRDAEKVIAEVVQHLTALVGADVTIRMEIEARHPDGMTEKLVRDLTENCNALRFESCEFEPG
jgi:hypothetical protein